MIDTEKMKALAMKVGGVEWYEAGDSVILPDGDTIACCQSSIGHMPEPIHYDDMVEYLVSVSPAKILKLIDAFEAAEREREQLRAELEAAAADKRDAERYRWMAEHFLGADFEWGRCEDGYGGIPALVIEIPETAKVWGCLDLTIDDQLSRAPASEGEQK
ncbi:hypothetical protein [Burkholderia multivorans]|uniref:hypothetical protein n=1 Tax=Burkholderia multivorans TaxID=87883 RepID=UPI0021599B4D|nr:hypothetical protein [Burkholderia multivorans]